MRNQRHRLRRRILLTKLRCALAVGVVGIFAAQPGLAGGWAPGHVFVGVSGGQYQVHDNNGVSQETILTGLGGTTTGGAFDGSRNRLYTTAFDAGSVVVFDTAHPHTVVQTISVGSAPESIALDSAGNIYVGHQSSAGIHKYDAAGVFQAAYTPALDGLGPDQIDISVDDRTIYYTSEGLVIRRYDVLTNTQLADFALLPGTSHVTTLRLLPPFDGSGGLIVAQREVIRRLDAAGATVQSYDAPGEDVWYALDLDPNGTSFWASVPGTGNFYRFDIATGAVELGPFHLPTTSLYGLIVAGGDVVLPGRFCFGDGSGAACPCGNTSTPGDNLGCLNSHGYGAGLVATGWPSISADSLVLAGSNMPNNFALYLQGTGQANGSSGIVFGDGLRCVGGLITRLGRKLNAAGASQYPGPGDASISVRGLVTAPGDRTYQVWYRDAATFCSPSTFNLSNGMRVTWVP